MATSTHRPHLTTQTPGDHTDTSPGCDTNAALRFTTSPVLIAERHLKTLKPETMKCQAFILIMQLFSLISSPSLLSQPLLPRRLFIYRENGSHSVVEGTGREYYQCGNRTEREREGLQKSRLFVDRVVRHQRLLLPLHE